MKYIYLFFLMLLGFSSLGQRILSSAGNTCKSEDLIIDFTIGEIITHTYKGSTISGTQGFHQPYLTIAAIRYPDPISDIRLYPNPTEDFVILEFPKLDQDYAIELYNTNGKRIVTKQIYQIETYIDVSKLATAVYFLRVLGSNKKKIKIYKIVKTK